MILTDFYITYFTILILIIGSFVGLIHVFSIMNSYEAVSKFTYNEICSDTFGNSYAYDDFNTESKVISCRKETASGVSLKRHVYID